MAMPYVYKKSKYVESWIAAELEAWDGVMPPCWDDTEAKVESSKKFKEHVLLHFLSVESTNEQSRPCGYISFAVCHRGIEESFDWGRRGNCKLVKRDGSFIFEK